eukprot:4045974-Prymnesium_polylepis.1
MAATLATEWQIDGVRRDCTREATGIGMQSVCQLCLAPGAHVLNMTHGQVIIKTASAVASRVLLEAVMASPDADLNPGSRWQQQVFLIPVELGVPKLPAFEEGAEVGSQVCCCGLANGFDMNLTPLRRHA